MINRYTDHAANERTYLAWVRTAIAVMAFGFLVEKFDLFLEVAAQSLSGQQPTALNQAVGDVAGMLGTSATKPVADTSKVDLSRQLGLTLRAGVQGAASLPGLVIDAARYPGYLAGRGLGVSGDFTPTGEVVASGLDRLGVPRPVSELPLRGRYRHRSDTGDDAEWLVPMR